MNWRRLDREAARRVPLGGLAASLAPPSTIDGPRVDPATVVPGNPWVRPARGPCDHLWAEEVVVAPRLVALGWVPRLVVACVCPDCPAVLPADSVERRRKRRADRYRAEAARQRRQRRCAHDEIVVEYTLAGGLSARWCADCGAVRPLSD